MSQINRSSASISPNVVPDDLDTHFLQALEIFAHFIGPKRPAQLDSRERRVIHDNLRTAVEVHNLDRPLQRLRRECHYPFSPPRARLCLRHIVCLARDDDSAICIMSDIHHVACVDEHCFPRVGRLRICDLRILKLSIFALLEKTCPSRRESEFGGIPKCEDVELCAQNHHDQAPDGEVEWPAVILNDFRVKLTALERDLPTLWGTACVDCCVAVEAQHVAGPELHGV